MGGGGGGREEGKHVETNPKFFSVGFFVAIIRAKEF